MVLDNMKTSIKRLLKAGSANNTIKSYQSDLKYFWAWAKLVKGAKEAYPVVEKLVMAFVLSHLEGLPGKVDRALVKAGIKAKPGKHSVTTVERRVKALVWAHKMRGLPAEFKTEQIRASISAAKRISSKAGISQRKSRAITKDLLNRMLKTFGNSLHDLRDKAMLVFGFYTGGRRRSEIVAARFENLTKIRGGYSYIMPRSKTDQTGKGKIKILWEPHARHLTNWLKASGIKSGYLFRPITRWGHIGEQMLSPEIVNKIVKHRIEAIGLDPRFYSAHGLRRGFMTECGRQGKGLVDAMQCSDHRDVRTAITYYEEGQIMLNPATRI